MQAPAESFPLNTLRPMNRSDKGHGGALINLPQAGRDRSARCRPGKLRSHVLSSLNEFPIRSRPYAGLEIASLQFPTFREADR